MASLPTRSAIDDSWKVADPAPSGDADDARPSTEQDIQRYPTGLVIDGGSSDGVSPATTNCEPASELDCPRRRIA